MLKAFTNQLMVLLTICIGASATVFAHRTFTPSDPSDTPTQTGPAQRQTELPNNPDNPRRRVDSEGHIPDNAQPSNSTHQ